MRRANSGSTFRYHRPAISNSVKHARRFHKSIRNFLAAKKRKRPEIIPQRWRCCFVKFRVSFNKNPSFVLFPPWIEGRICDFPCNFDRRQLCDWTRNSLPTGSMSESLKIISQPTIDPSCRSMGDDVLSSGLTDFRGTSPDDRIPFISSPFDITPIPFFAHDTE